MVLLLASMLVPVVVLGSWAAGAEDGAEVLGSARDALLFSLGTALGVGALLAVLGLGLARLSLRLSPGREALLLAALLAPLAAPGVMFAVGEIRLWNAPWNPLADLVYPAPALLVLSIAGRYLCLGVLAARTLLLRLDAGPLQAARLAGRPACSATLAHRIFSLVHIASDDVTAVLCVALVALVVVPAVAARLLGLPGVDCGPPTRGP